MSVKFGDKRLSGVWSATPTPFDKNFDIDARSVKRMVDRHISLGVNGLFLAGTCGEGAWLTCAQFERLIKVTADCSKGRLLIAAQVTDNSASRIIENTDIAKDAGADIAVIAPPHFLLNATPENLTSLYREAIRASSLPVGLYDRGRHGAVQVPEDVFAALLLEKNVIMMKDSSSDPARRERALAVRKRRPGLALLNGDEINAAPYMTAGYDGVLLGGAIVVGHCARLMMDAANEGDERKLTKLQSRMKRLLLDMYGGETISCWLSGLKHTLVEMGIFSTHRNLLGYPLTDACRRAVGNALKRDADLIFPAAMRN